MQKKCLFALGALALTMHGVVRAQLPFDTESDKHSPCVLSQEEINTFERLAADRFPPSRESCLECGWKPLLDKLPIIPQPVVAFAWTIAVRTALDLRNDWADWETRGIIPPPLNSSAPPGNVEIDDSLRMLLHPSEPIRARAAGQLGRLKAYRAVDALTLMVCHDPSPEVRAAAARSLGLIGARDSRARTALFALEKAAHEDGEPRVRFAAEFAAEIIRQVEE